MCSRGGETIVGKCGESAHMAFKGKDKGHETKKGKGKLPAQADIKKESKCFFCKKKGHIKKDCVKYKAWSQKKGKYYTSFVCYESNMDVCHNTWWIDSGSTIHNSNTLQGFLNHRKSVGSEHCIYSGNMMRSRVEAVGTCRIVLSSDFVLGLERTVYVPSFPKNLISVSRLVPFGYSFNFSDPVVKLFYKSDLVGNGGMSDDLFQIYLQDNASYNAMHVQAGIKRCVMNESSSILWHRRLGHISQSRIKMLVNDGVLNALDFTDFDTCIACIKGKQTNKSKKGATRSSDILEIRHTDICSPSMDSYGQKYFITFIDDYSRYKYLYKTYMKHLMPLRFLRLK